jgi:hypothetical protein
MSLYFEISACNHMVYLTFPFSQALSLNHSSSQSLFSSWLIFFVVVHSQEVYTLYIVKAKENSRGFVWQIIVVDGEWCSECGLGKGKVKE